MGKRLQTLEDHVTDITISTATVDIQVMRIGTKQMTLAVFRQLPTKDIFDRSGNLLADPWGWVNYDCAGPQTNFVFSHEGVLYRDQVRVKRHYELVVKAQKYSAHEYSHWDRVLNEQVPGHQKGDLTGKWIIEPRDTTYDFHTDCPIRFKSEADATAHLANRMKGITVLEAAPQLFIGV